jgi:hypothetical protein
MVNFTVSAFVRYWAKADKDELWPEKVCPLMTQSGHRGLALPVYFTAELEQK